MLVKCSYCDTKTKRGEKPVKSIDIEKDDFVKDKGKYYHTNCYKKLLQKKKKSEPEIEQIIQEKKREQADEVKEKIQKDKFLTWIKNYYDSSLPSYFLKKVHSIRKGTYELVNEPIDYETLLDIYQLMANYLNKNAARKQFKSIVQRMNYDLAVVIGNYGDYKRYKEKQLLESKQKEEVIRKIQEEMSRSNKKMNTNNEFSLSDVIDDILL